MLDTKPVFKPSSQTFNSTNATSNITYEPIHIKSVLPDLSFTTEGKGDDQSRYLPSRAIGISD
jgi:hypothetical protein